MPSPTKTKAKLTTITAFADDVFKVDFEIEKKYARFKPGQFLHLTLDDFDPTQAYWPESRVFSICSVPKSATISIIYSVKGSYTSRMRDELRIGGEYWLKLPYGDFIIDQLVPEGATAVLIAGGTGISPYVSYLEEGAIHGFGRSVYLAYAVRSPDRLAFGDVIWTLKSGRRLPMRIWSEGGAHDCELITDIGRLDLNGVVQDVVGLPDPHFLLSGPPAMLDAFSQRLRSLHEIASSRIHIDEWE